MLAAPVLLSDSPPLPKAVLSPPLVFDVKVYAPKAVFDPAFDAVIELKPNAVELSAVEFASKALAPQAVF